MIEKCMKYMSEHSVISTIFMIFLICVLFFIYLIIKITLEKSWNISERVSWISDIVAMIAIPSIAVYVRKLNKTFREQFKLDQNEDDNKKFN